MAVLSGFQYVSGPMRMVLSTVSSTATFKAFNPVTLSDDRTLIEADSDTTAVMGIAQQDAANSIYAGKCLVLVPENTTVFESKITTTAVASEISMGQSVNIEKFGDYLWPDEDSQSTPMVTIVPRDDGSTLDSTNSSIRVVFLGDKIGVFGSNASVSIFAQN
jgi:hypothetical protein